MFSYMHDHASSRMHAHIHTRTHVHIRTYIHALSRCLIRGKFFCACWSADVSRVRFVTAVLDRLSLLFFLFYVSFYRCTLISSFLTLISSRFLFLSCIFFYSPPFLSLRCFGFTTIKISIHKISIHVSTRSFSLSALPSFLAPPFRPCLCIFLPLPIPLPSLFSACPPSLRHPRVPRHKQPGRGNFRLLIGHHADLLPVRLQQQQRAFI